MKQSIQRILVGQTIIFASLLLTACGSPFGSNHSHEYQIPWRAGDGNYKLQTVTIDSLSDPEHLSGSAVQLFVTPTDGNGHLSSGQPAGHFMTRKDGVHVPLDFVSMQGAAINAHFEKIREFDRAVGVDSLISWPIEISIETDVTGPENRNNAFYDHDRNAILILPFIDDTKEGLPISLNGGVLAHEHFHEIFYNLVSRKIKNAGGQVTTKIRELYAPPVLSRSTEDTDSKVGSDEPKANAKEFNDFLLRGANEGLADFWSWLAIGDDRFVGRSIVFLDDCRRLDTKFTQVPPSAEVKYTVFANRDSSHPEKQAGDRLFMAYQVGAQYARFLKELSTSVYGQGLSLADRIQIAQSLVHALSGYGDIAVSEFNTTEIATDSIVDSVVKAIPAEKFNEASCEVIAEFKVSGAQLPEACAKFKLKPEDILKKKAERTSHRPPWEHCSCVDERGRNWCG